MDIDSKLLLEDTAQEAIAILIQVAGDYTYRLENLLLSTPEYIQSLSPEQLEQLVDIQTGYADLFQEYNFPELVLASGRVLEILLEKKFEE